MGTAVRVSGILLCAGQGMGTVLQGTVLQGTVLRSSLSSHTKFLSSNCHQLGGSGAATHQQGGEHP